MRRCIAGAVVAVLASAGAIAQELPPPLTIVVPYAAGGPTDLVGRLIAGPMANAIGRTIHVENVTGAGGTVGAAEVAQAEPDGSTLLLYNIGMATGATLYRNLPYDPLADFSPVGLVNDVPMTLVGRKDLPPDDMAGLVEYVRANRETMTYANAGIGSGSHLCGLLLMDAIGVEVKQVSYAGTAPALEDLVAGKVDLLCDQSINATDRIVAGAVKAYVTTSPERLAQLPDLPTVAEAGMPGLELAIWNGLFAPAGTPEAVVGELVGALQAALGDGHVAGRLTELGSAPASASEATPATLKAKVESEIARWRPLIEKAGAYAD